MYNEDNQASTPSLRRKLKFCCFSSSVHHQERLEDYPDKPRTPRSPCAWFKSTNHDLPEIRGRCRNLISRIGRARRHHHSHSADFSYDPLSYALNFEDDSRIDEFPLHFAARLAASPPPPQNCVSDAVAIQRTEIVAFS